jgi:hypothetical protein
MALPKNRKRPESVLYPLVQDYFESVQDRICWSEEQLSRIQPRSLGGKFESGGYPTPDLIAVDFSSREITAVEIKSNTTPGQLDECIGKLMRMLRFANKGYGAFPHSIPKSVIDTFVILNKNAPQIGLLEVNSEKSDTPVVEHVIPTRKEAHVRDEWRRYFLELPRARAIPFDLSPVSHVSRDDESKHIIVEISESTEKRFEHAKTADSLAANELIRELWMWIDDVLIECWEKYGKETPIDLVSRNFTVCSQCKHAKVKGEPCVTCQSEGRSAWEGEDMVDEDVSLRFEEE